MNGGGTPEEEHFLRCRVLYFWKSPELALTFATFPDDQFTRVKDLRTRLLVMATLWNKASPAVRLQILLRWIDISAPRAPPPGMKYENNE